MKALGFVVVGCLVLGGSVVGCGSSDAGAPGGDEDPVASPMTDGGRIGEDGGLQLDVGSSEAAPQPWDDASCATTSATASKSPVDIIVAVDQSASMNDDILRVRDNINKLSSHLGATGLDYRVVMIGWVGTVPSGGITNVICVPPPLGGPVSLCDSPSPLKNSNPPLFRTSNDYIGSSNSLMTVYRTYDGPEGQRWNDFARVDAFKAIIPVTDDNSFLTAEEFDSQILAKSAAMFGTPTARKYAAYPIMGAAAYPSEAKCGTTMVNNGSNYIALAKMTKGKWWPLCSTDWSKLFTEIASSIAQRVACEFVVPPPPSGMTLDPNKVNVTYTPSGGATEAILRDDTAPCESGANGWQYNADKTKILLCGNACTKAQSDSGAKVDVAFGCATVFKPPS